jgi:DNA (cytosine-5)-methyltransferase 1
MTKPILLDLFCGAGGASMGYHRAGFDVVGVDINPQPRYPFPFLQMDAIEALKCLQRERLEFIQRDMDTDGGYRGHIWFCQSDVDVIHASPPCQAYSKSTPMRNRDKHPDLVGIVRSKLQQLKIFYVIENVPGAPIRNDIVLEGCMVGLLEIKRERIFETEPSMFQLRNCPIYPGPVISVVGHGSPTGQCERLGRNVTVKDWRRVMGIDWMTRDELTQAIPPAYTEYIGKQIMNHLRGSVSPCEVKAP